MEKNIEAILEKLSAMEARIQMTEDLISTSSIKPGVPKQPAARNPGSGSGGRLKPGQEKVTTQKAAKPRPKPARTYPESDSFPALAKNIYKYVQLVKSVSNSKELPKSIFKNLDIAFGNIGPPMQ